MRAVNGTKLSCKATLEKFYTSCTCADLTFATLRNGPKIFKICNYVPRGRQGMRMYIAADAAAAAAVLAPLAAEAAAAD